MKRLIIATAAAILLSGCGGSKPIPAGRLPQPAGKFSYITPDGWYRKKLSGINFIIVSTDADGGANPNIFVERVVPSAALSNVTAELIKTNQDNHKTYLVKTQTDFTTESELSGTKIIAERKNKDALSLALLHYIIEDNGRVIVITCTCAKSVKDKYEPIFDAAMKSVSSDAQ